MRLPQTFFTAYYGTVLFIRHHTVLNEERSTAIRTTGASARAITSRSTAGYVELRRGTTVLAP